MRLGGKAKDVDSFVDQLKSEGQEIIATAKQVKQAVGAAAPTPLSTVKMDSVHLRVEEKLSLVMNRDGGLQSLEVHGLMALRVAEDKFTKVKVRVDNNDKMGAQLQTHPNLDKKAFTTDGMLVLKSPPKPFPLQNDVGVLKWRFQTTDEAFIPLAINCWPSETGQRCEVNIEYTLESNELELNDVVISIPLPHGVAPVVGDCEGEYRYDRPKNVLEWRLTVIDSSNKQGSLEFTTNSGHADNFFPVKVSFASKQQFCDIKPAIVYQMDDDSQVKYSTEGSLVTEKYEII